MLIHIFAFLTGLAFGSFCNVLVFRLPKGEDFVKTPSHCMACGKRLGALELIPVVSYLAQKGKCKHCGAKISAQYPAVEVLNGIMWLLVSFVFSGDIFHIALYSLLFSFLLTLSVIDLRFYEIPNGLNLAIFILGLLQLAFDFEHKALYISGMFSVSVLLFLIWAVTKGKGMGFGDVKLMAAAGLLIGFPKAILSLFIGSLAGSVIHLIRMKRGAGKKLAFGPYLSLGIWISVLFGEPLIDWYMSLCGF